MINNITFVDKNKNVLSIDGMVVQTHQEKEFEGVASWMGEEYANIPHHNIETEKIEVSPSDFLFIPEFYCNVMSQTSKMPCKRVAIAQNFNYLTQVIPAGVSWEQYGIKDCIVSTDRLENEINNCFPKVKTYKVNPCIDENIFHNDDKPKDLIFNIELLKNPIKVFGKQEGSNPLEIPYV